MFSCGKIKREGYVERRKFVHEQFTQKSKKGNCDLMKDSSESVYNLLSIGHY